ncbi:chloride channel CLIC-like protein 1 [Pelobates fuscus]|uniref:chloride channel CLIC-like protein 1 n=1 Tax=Pelobates fuscus TaxID=191477 RepID=UPI002FE43077
MEVVLLVFMVLIALCRTFQDDDEWIDPTDMLNYDAASGKMRKNMIMEEYKKKAQEEGSQCCSNPIFRRFLLKILGEVRRLGLPDESNSEVHYDAEVRLTRHMFAEIEKFLNDTDWSVGALDEALSRTLVKFKPHNEEEWRWEFEDYVGVDAFTLFMILLCLLCVVLMIATEIWTHIGWYTQIKRIIILSIIISFGWNWLYLHKVAFAEWQAKIAKMKTHDSCGEKTSCTKGPFDWIKSSITFKNDPCEEYYKTLLMDPTTKALAITFTNFVTEPLKHFVKGIGEFISSLLSEIPSHLQIPVFICLTIALLAFCYGIGSSVGQNNMVRYLSGPDQGRRHAVEHQLPNPPPTAQEQLPPDSSRNDVSQPKEKDSVEEPKGNEDIQPNVALNVSACTPETEQTIRDRDSPNVETLTCNVSEQVDQNEGFST